MGKRSVDELLGVIVALAPADRQRLVAEPTKGTRLPSAGRSREVNGRRPEATERDSPGGCETRQTAGPTRFLVEENCGGASGGRTIHCILEVDAGEPRGRPPQAIVRSRQSQDWPCRQAPRAK